MIAAIAAAVPGIISTVASIGSSLARLFGSGPPSDPLEKVTDEVPPERISAHIGEGGWWYDNGDNHQLTQEEASARQHAVIAAMVHARVGSDGWWYDLVDGHKLSHAEAWSRYQALGGGAGYTGQSFGAGGAQTPATSYVQQQIDAAIAQTRISAANIVAGAGGAAAGAIGGSALAAQQRKYLMWGAVAVGAVVLVVIILKKRG
jgi:hypothetical protein